MANTVGIAFLVVFCFSLVLDVALTVLNLRHMQVKGTSLPSVFRPYIDEEIHRRSIAYNIEAERFGILQTLTDAAILIVFIYFGGFEVIDEFARSVFPGGYYGSALIFAGVTTLVKLVVALPFDLYDTFVIEERHGFNKTTPKLFVVDLLKSLALLVVLGIPLYLAILWFMHASGTFWWLWTWIFLGCVQIVMIVVYPIWIAPLFNKFTPLEDGPLKDRIIDLAENTSFPLQKIFIMDGSKRSGHSNAYFTGIGRKKRIVLFDTLLAKMGETGIVSVLAHEIGHYKLRHILKAILFNSIGSLIGLWVLSLLAQYLPFYHGLGFSQPSNYAALIIFGLCASTVSFLFKPLFSFFSRKREYQADRFAVWATKDKKSMADAIAVLTKENLSNLNPHPWYSFFHYSHPAPVERVKAILETKS